MIITYINYLGFLKTRAVTGYDPKMGKLTA